MGKLTLEQAATWCHGETKPEFASRSFTGVSYDTRELQPGQLFVAIAGEKRDGHDFAHTAMEAGAAAVLGQRFLEDIPMVVAENSVRALGDIARAYRNRLQTKVIGITGSVGKTTTKEMIAAILKTTYKTAKTPKNYNNEIGLPLSILNMDDDCEMAVLEMGMNHFHEMSYLTSIALPDVALITNIGTMHIEHLGSREGILRAKLEILEGLQRDGRTIFNGDEPLLWNLKSYNRVKPIYFGIENAECDLRAVDVENLDGGMSFRVCGLGHEFAVFLPVEGLHNVYDALAAIAVALLYRVSPVQIQEALGGFQNSGMRQKTYERDGYTVIEDCYNAGPESMAAALSVLSGKAGKGKRIAVLGDMLELGACSQAEHYRVGRLAAQAADVILAYGKNGARVVDGAITGGVDPKKVRAFDTHEALVEALRRFASPGDTLLFKGSRGMRMERVLELFFAQNELGGR